MPRAYHSISSVLLGMRCPRAWAYRYIAGLREPEHAWNDPKAPPRSRSSARWESLPTAHDLADAA